MFEGVPFFADGFNCYFLTFCSDAIRYETLLTAKRLGANTIRSWAFLDLAGPGQRGPSFQYSDGNAIQQNDGPEGLGRLDHLIFTAESFNLKLILPLVNYWPDFGGMPMYLTWLGLSDDNPAVFYRSSRARDAYKAWVNHVLNRRNLLTGRRYSEEPAVLAWELANEPRSMGPGGREVLLDWIREMSEFVKEQDSSHLLATGDEGFFCRRARSHLYNGTYGVDFDEILGLPTIDFGTFHMYLQHWGEQADSNFAQKWMEDHLEAGARAGKPVILEEFGLSCADGSETTEELRGRLYRDWTGQMRNGGGAGALVWMLGNESSETAGFRDKYTIFAPAQSGFGQ